MASDLPLLQKTARIAWEDRWWALLGVATQGALAASLLARSGKSLVPDAPAAWAPELDILSDGQHWAAEAAEAED